MSEPRLLNLWIMADYYLWLTLVFVLVVFAYLSPLVVGGICIWKGLAMGNFWFFSLGLLLIVADILFWIDSAGHLKPNR